MTTLQKIPTSKSLGTTIRQRELLDAIRRLTADNHGLPPTVRELCVETSTTVGDVQQKLLRMRRDGIVIWRDGKACTLRIIGG